MDEKSGLVVTQFNVFCLECSYSTIYRNDMNCELFPGIITNFLL